MRDTTAEARRKVMSKRMAGVLAAVLFAAVAVYASDVWKDKDFENWDQKDVDKILKDSPWTKQVQYGGDGPAAGNEGYFCGRSAKESDNRDGYLRDCGAIHEPKYV